MTDDDIRDNKEILRDEHADAKQVLATLYSNTRRIADALRYHAATVQTTPQAAVLPRFKESGSSSNGLSIDGLNINFLQQLMDEIAQARAQVAQYEGEMRRLHVEFVPFGDWP